MEFILPPQGFLNVDILIEGFSFITVLLFSILCIKNYRLNKNKKFLYLGAGFGLITLAQLIITVVKAVLYYDVSFIGMNGDILIPYNLFNFLTVFYNIGIFAYRGLILLGLYTLYRAPKNILEKDSLIVLFLITIVTIFSKDIIHLFHITELIFITLIILKYSEIHHKNKSKGTLILMIAFMGLALSSTVFIFAKLMTPIYVVASLVELASYLTLLILIVRILEHGKNNNKKTKQNGYNI
jgi:hypothetical protein